jgi:hypothetical protein
MCDLLESEPMRQQVACNYGISTARNITYYPNIFTNFKIDFKDKHQDGFGVSHRKSECRQHHQDRQYRTANILKCLDTLFNRCRLSALTVSSE